jgi:hypothetical protein
MKSLKPLYLIACIAGTVMPWYFFSLFFAQEGFDVIALFRNFFGNDAASGAMWDLLVSILIFWVWSFFDARTRGVKHWWIVLPATALVGLSLAMPLYLYWRAD